MSWNATDSQRLHPTVRTTIDEAKAIRQQLMVCFISFWEIAVLIKKCLYLGVDASEFVTLYLQKRDIMTSTMTADIADL